MSRRNSYARSLIFSAAVIALQPMVADDANAQSSVTLYGIVDASILYTTNTLNTKTGMNAGSQLSFTDSGFHPTVFGMRGTEDLGGGLRAVFALESGVSIANGALGHSNGNLFGRQAWVGLNSRYGSVKAGVQFSPFFISLFALDPREGSFFGSGFINYADNVAATGLFNSNSISYTSPEIAGIQTAVMYALGGAAGNFQAGRQYSANLTYHLGGFLLTGAMYSGNSGGSASTTPIPSTVEFTGRMVGATYRFPNDLVIKASYTLYKVAGSFDSKVYSAGGSYAFSPFVDFDAGIWYTQDGNSKGNHSLLAASGINFALSKRTSLYGQVGYVTNHGLMHTGLSINNALYEVTGSTVGVSLGIRHMF
ncbi:porin [Paraburkholderia bannensis]|uniref:porin n=1 Tax=Paraburkholderia bannensis TaxID=765414 RepID=UPI002AB2FAB9|nr:porin [Paraburkholderia bannensis]